eukprot:TRINITY_DN2222_c0_g1_i1.p1 TRINITY_DN2222_c0_g1~~TRINITY_DN2222_c0_g1_i1.p1  ORF type:complete len:309 (+),score=110.49 TRINITY_DN2222_c0_g1_i1:122-1048(+)
MAELLNSVTIEDLFEHENFPELASVKTDDNIKTVGNVLSNGNFYSVPVFEGDECVGLIDLNDLMTKILSFFEDDEGNYSAEKVDQVQSNPKATGMKYFALKAGDCINASGSNPFEPINVKSTLTEVINKFKEAKRLPVVDDSGKILTILSPSTIIKFLGYHVLNEGLEGNLADAASTILSNENNVLTIKGDDRVIDTIRKMVTNKLSSVAIVDENGKLYSTLSVKDLTLLNTSDKFSKLFTSVNNWVLEIRRKTLKAIFPAINCRYNDTLEKVLLRLAATRIHRLFITNDNGTPIGVVSARDLLFSLA